MPSHEQYYGEKAKPVIGDPLDMLKKEIDVQVMTQQFTVRINPNLESELCQFTAMKMIRGFNKIAVAEVQTVTYEWPLDWWQAIKERFAPRWFVKRWPVMYMKKFHNVFAHYPDFDIPGQRSVVVMQQGQKIGEK